MKLSILTASVSRNAGGLFTSVRKLTQSIQKDGVACQVHAFKDEHTGADVGAWVPLDVTTYAGKGFPFFPVSLPMRNAVIASYPDIVHCHGVWQYPSLIDLAIKSKLSVPYVISLRGMLDAWAVKNSAWKKKLIGFLFENRHLRNASCIHALCQSEADSIRAYGLKNPIAIIPNGVDLSDFAPSAFNLQGLKKRRRLLFLGRIHPKKGLRELIEAWAMVQEAWGANWELVIAGWDDGGHLDGLKKQATSLGLQWAAGELGSDLCPSSSAFHFVGPKFGAEKDSLLRSVDAFILPSFSEGLPMSVLEAWSYGLPVIMTSQCNIPLGFDLRAAVRIDPEAESIAEGLRHFFSLPNDEQEAMGLRGRRMVEKQFTWEKIAEDMCSVYKWILGGGSPPACVRLD